MPNTPDTVVTLPDDDEPQNWRELAEAAIMDLRGYADDELPYRRMVSAEAYEQRFALLDANQALDTADEGMVERVARAISLAAYDAMRSQGFSGGWDHGEFGQAIARAAIEATGVSTLLARVERLEGALDAIDKSAFIGATADSQEVKQTALESINDIAREAIEVSLP